MKQAFTENSLVQYLYHETKVSDNAKIETSIQSSNETQKSYKDMLQVQSYLDDERIKPSHSLIRDIISYSKK